MRAKLPKTNEAAYIIKMKVSSDLQKFPFFKVMNEMLSILQKKTGKRAFSNFKELNLNPLLD